MADEKLNAPLDHLAPAVRAVLAMRDRQAYTKLVVDGSERDDESLTAIAAIKPDKVLSVFVSDLQSARAVLAGLYLWHDHLDPSHAISQALENPTGSFWHAILHRREGDFSNSKYWYARAEGHPVESELGIKAGELINPHPADKKLFRIIHDGWDGAAFVDLVQSVYRDPDHRNYGLAVALQQLEFRVLFDHCARAAMG